MIFAHLPKNKTLNWHVSDITHLSLIEQFFESTQNCCAMLFHRMAINQHKTANAMLFHRMAINQHKTAMICCFTERL